MAIAQKTLEIKRLISLFESEASKFHDLTLSTVYFTQGGASSDRKLAVKHHAIMLWQYYGPLGAKADIANLFKNLQESDHKWGLRGAEYTSYAIIEGEMTDLFVRMAKRAGGIFDKSEATEISNRVVAQISEVKRSKDPSMKPVAVANRDPLAIWLNYLLYHLSLTDQRPDLAPIVSVEPFTLSLLALERILEEKSIGTTDRSSRKIADIKFKIALSFPGEKRLYVSQVVDVLRQQLSADSIFYDYDYQAQLARPNLDVLLQDIYRHQSELLVVFLCAEYEKKNWCGLEWRAIRDIIKCKEDERVMFVRFDDAEIKGVFSIDGYIDARKETATNVAQLILDRLNTSPA